MRGGEASVNVSDGGGVVYGGVVVTWCGGNGRCGEGYKVC